MARALDVARYLVHLAAPSENEDTDCLCHLRLQKLLYYVQGWHLAAYGKPLFAGRIEAWTNGPVVREVYPQFADYRWQSIPPSCGKDDPETLSGKEKDFIRSVWDQYKVYSATALREMTHKEKPWVDARAGLAPNERCDTEITQESLRSYFSPLLEEKILKSDPRIDKDSWDRTREAIRSGRTRTAGEIRNELHRRSSRSDQR